MKKNNVWNENGIRYYNKLPYNWKYYEENPLLSEWFIVGEGEFVDINDVCDSVFSEIPREKAKQIVKARDEFTRKLEQINSDMKEYS